MNSLDKLTSAIQSSIRESDGRRPKPYDSTATVTRVEGDTLWVHIPGGVEETPIKKTINAVPGDVVNVHIRHGGAWITGNSTVPPTGDAEALVAQAQALNADLKAMKSAEEAKIASENADAAKSTAVDAKETAEAILVYDHTYYVLNGVAKFTAHLYQGGVDVTENFDPTLFTWYRKDERTVSGYSDGMQYLGNGYTLDVAVDSCGYGIEIIGRFSQTEDSVALDHEGSTLTNGDDEPYSVRATGDSIRVRDLETRTTIYDAEKLMVIGTEDEHLITAENFYNYILYKLSNEIIYCGSSTEVVG